MFIIMNITATQAQSQCRGPRKMWASINNIKNASLGDYQAQTGKVLISWRMLPSDNWDTSFLLYSQPKNGGTLTRVTTTPIVNSTCYQLTSIPNTATTYYLIKGEIENPPASINNANEINAFISANALDQMELTSRAFSQKLPYHTIKLQDTHNDVCSIDTIFYQANDVSVGDLDGDGETEIVVKRLQTVKDSKGNLISDGVGASTPHKGTIHAVIWDAYKLDGTLLWRIKGGPAVMLGNSTAFAIADFDGDGKCEMAIRTGEGTVFGDGTQIGDTNGDGKTDYRTWTGGYVDHYNSAGPEFLSIIDGKTGRELARTNFINRDTSQSWGDGYWKRANSFRVGAACFDKTGLPSVVLGRGVYARSVLEAWDYRNGKLTRRWHVDTSESWTGKDGNPSSAYAAQGNHAFNAADLDGDGFDEIMYGSMAIDQDGVGLWTTKLGHGDANHVGKFLPDREGLQMYHCLESGKTQVALHDAATGAVIWKKEGSSDNDMGRCLVADINPSSPGCEFWMYGSKVFDINGYEIADKPASCNMAIWFDGSLSRQLINESIIHSPANGRTFTIYRYDHAFINGTKSNTSWYGDLFGDWREEFIVPDATLLNDLKIFSTWYPSDHKFPYLMSDHNYYMQTINQNIGYNQPNHLSYFLGTGMDMSQVPVGLKELSQDNQFASLNKPGIIRTAWYETDINVLYPTVAYDVKPVIEDGVLKYPTLTAQFTDLQGNNTNIASQSFLLEFSQAQSVSGWTVSNNANILNIANNNDNYGNFLELNLGNSSSRWTYNQMTEADTKPYNCYNVEFDLAITPGNKDAGTEFCIMSNGGTLPSTYWHNYVYNVNNKQHFLFDITGTAKSTPLYYLNGTRDDATPQTVGIASGTWLHYKLQVNKKDRTVRWSISNGNSGTYNVPETSSMEFGGVCMLATRNQAAFKLDNISVYPNDYQLLRQDYENAEDNGSWQMNYNGMLGTLELVSGDTDYNGGKYIKYTHSGNGARTVFTKFYEKETGFYDACGTYRMQFDTKIKKTNGNGNNSLVIFAEGAAMPKGNKAWEDDKWIFKLYGGNNTDLYTIDLCEGYTKDIELDSEAWYHFQLDIHRASGTVFYAIADTQGNILAQGQYATGKRDGQLNAQGMAFTCGRTQSYAAFDNIDISIPAECNSYTFSEPGTLTVTASLSGHLPTTSSYTSEIATKVSDIGYSTLSYPLCNLDFSANNNLKLFTVKVNNGNQSVTTQEVESKVLPSQEAALIKAPQGIYAASIADNAASLSDNDLIPCTHLMTGNDNIYVLNKVNNKVGFFKLNNEGRLSAGKGYLLIGGTLVKSMADEGELDETTDISHIYENGQSSQKAIIFDLAGRRIEKPANGIYIVNGKKVLIK